MKTYLELTDFLHEESLEEKMMNLARRFKKVRRKKGFSQMEIANRSLVSYGSVKRFETTGQISLKSLFRLAFVLHAESQLDSLFESSEPTYEELIHGKHS